MNEVMRSLVQGGTWTPAERRFGRWLRNVLLVVMALLLLGWNWHMQRLAGRSQVWTQWVSAQCMSGQRGACLSYVDYATPAGLANEAFWVDHPALAKQASCIEAQGWLTLSVGRLDYRKLALRCGSGDQG